MNAAMTLFSKSTKANAKGLHCPQSLPLAVGYSPQMGFHSVL